jgi:hypothetical protein
MTSVKYRDISKYKYLLEEPLTVTVPIRGITARVDGDWVSLSEYGLLVIRKGYAWDGASGPAIDTPDFMRASLVHDALYQLLREGALPPGKRSVADAVMRSICREDGMGRFRSWYCWLGVRLFGGPAAAKEKAHEGR